MSAAEVRVLGPVEVVDDDGPVSLSAKQRRLLAALVVADGRACGVDELVWATWGESSPASAAKLVQVYVSQLRKVLPNALRIVTRAGAYALELEHDVLDAHRFERLVAESRSVRATGNPALAASLIDQALHLWRGRAYGDLAYEELARAEADRLEELRLVALGERIDGQLALGSHAGVLGEILGLAAEHPLRERMQEQAMLALYRCGRQAEALDHYGAVRRTLQDELGLEPGPALRELQQRILRHDAALEVDAARVERGMLPAPVGPIVGRKSELDELSGLLRRRAARFIVLAGAGGSGKTRLALEAARRAAPSFANGAVLVELAPLRDAALVAATIASALAPTVGRGRATLEALGETLAPRELLLVIDNAEHLREAAPLYVDLLARAPRLTLLVTSRTVLHVTGERVFPVAPLTEDAAAELFEQRARALDPTFARTQENDEHVREICRRTDGLPLAVELAATWIRLMPPAMLRELLGERLRVLTGGPRDLPARQQTLRATVEWSYDLLEPDAQRAFGALAVFRGGWTIADAESVCGAGLGTVGSLVDHSLVTRRRRSVRGEELVMLETVRELAEELLDADRALATPVRRRHAKWILSLAEASHLTSTKALGREVFEPDWEGALAVKDDVRAALDWAVESDPLLAAEIFVALEQLWVTHTAGEGMRRAESILRSESLPASLRASVLRVHGAVSALDGNPSRAMTSYDRALALFREHGPESEAVAILTRFAIHAAYDGDVAQTRRLVSEVRASDAIAKMPGVEAQCLSALADIAKQAGDTAAALELQRRALATAAACGFRLWEGWGASWMAQLAFECDLLDEAVTAARTALVFARRADDLRFTIRVLTLLAAIVFQQGDKELAGRLWGAVDADEAHLRIVEADPELVATVAPLRTDDDPSLLAAVSSGRQLSLDQAAARALQQEIDGTA
ncbi:BTAD domain-containing putative transcriptional regulator [Gaiella sp.]|uniref:BTAD domain-containing putative transcriptional regulator n=1 Tax=Gaiella sp. TaxID=2663207 RepID=UPI002C8D157B|nr:BTAD domain-containing putative transcriptional regulator [Gaiella sp.]HWO79017.1 BTAD domain-containing putative transcriptional regulator [Gaiella sp.]